MRKFTLPTLLVLFGVGVGLMLHGPLCDVEVAEGHKQRGRPVAPAVPSTITLPKLPSNVKTILNITNDPDVGVSVGFINTDGNPEMVQFSFEYSNTGNFIPVDNKHYHFRFRK